MYELRKPEDRPKYLEERIDDLEAKLDRILRILERNAGRMSMQEIAAFWGVTKSSLYRSKRYLLPDFGRNVPHNGYLREDVMRWADKGEAQLYKEWKGLV